MIWTGRRPGITVAAALLGCTLLWACGSSASKQSKSGSGSGSGSASRPFASSSPWNTPTPASTQWFDSSLLHGRDWWVNTDLGITWSSPSDPIWTFDLPAFTGDDWHRTRPATRIHARAPQTLTPQPSDDLVVIAADPSTGDYIEIWAASVDRTNLTVTGQVWGSGNMITGLGVGDATTNLNAGVRASNFAWAAGLITQADVTSGKIDHGLALALPPDMVKGGSPPVGPYRAPATAGNGEWPTGPILMGSKIGIPAGIPRPPGLSSIGNMVFDALQTYGAYVGDVCGGSPAFTADGPSMGLPTGSGVDNTPVDPLVACWNHGGICDMKLIGPLLRVADYQP